MDKYQITEIGKVFLSLTDLKVLNDKKTNHECKTEGGSCTTCDAINMELYFAGGGTVDDLPRSQGGDEIL